jgi:hypothetical protein
VGVKVQVAAKQVWVALGVQLGVGVAEIPAAGGVKVVPTVGLIPVEACGPMGVSLLTPHPAIKAVDNKATATKLLLISFTFTTPNAFLDSKTLGRARNVPRA